MKVLILPHDFVFGLDKQQLGFTQKIIDLRMFPLERHQSVHYVEKLIPYYLILDARTDIVHEAAQFLLGLQRGVHCRQSVPNRLLELKRQLQVYHHRVGTRHFKVKPRRPLIHALHDEC